MDYFRCLGKIHISPIDVITLYITFMYKDPLM